MKHSWNKKRVLVTGGTGFIGSFLVERLLDEGAIVRVPLRAENYRSLSARRSEVQWMEGDLRESSYCMKLLRGVDHVFHLASCRRNVEYHQKRSSHVLKENVRMTLALIEAMEELEHFPPVTFFSTANVPQEYDPLALSQQDKVDGYILGKALCEIFWFTAARQHNFPLLILRPVGVYGPRDTFSLEGNVIPSLMLKARDAKKELEVWGTGKQERAFLYVEDLVDAAFSLLRANVEGVQYITTGEVVTVRQLATMIRDLVHPGLPLHFDQTHTEGTRSIPRLPVHAALRRFPWTHLEEGLGKTLAWWQHSVYAIKHAETPRRRADLQRAPEHRAARRTRVRTP